MSTLRSRTFAIIKPASLQYRLNIESLLSEAGFEIIKERQIHFHPSDENLVHVFGDEAHTLTGGAVWVYVLEKENAVPDLLDLIGDHDPETARANAPQSIRARFGQSIEENVMYGAPDCDAAEMQIATIFASSPPFPPTEMSPNDADVPVLTDRGFTNRQRAVSEESQGSEQQKKVNTQFRARPVPPTTAQPSIQPRTTRAAALRAGIIPLPSSPKVRGPPTKADLAKTFANVPGHKRAASIAVASTAPPVIAPRPTRASMLRTGGQPAVHSPRPRASTTLTSETPGYKRQLNIQVASTAPPAIQPRATRASSLRTGQDPSPKKTPRPSTSSGPSNTFVGVPGHKRSESIPVASIKPPATAPRLNRSATLRARGTSAGPSAFKEPANSEEQPSERTLSTQTSRSSLSTPPSQPAVSRGRSGPPPSSYVPPPASLSPPRPPSVTRAPSIEPRTNRSALLRARMGTPTGNKNSSPKFIAV